MNATFNNSCRSRLLPRQFVRDFRKHLEDRNITDPTHSTLVTEWKIFIDDTRQKMEAQQ